MRHRFPSLLFVALCGLAPAALGNLLHWSAWLWGFMSMVTTSGSLLLVMAVLSGSRASTGPHEPGEAEPPTAPAEPPYQETQVIDAVLPSATDGYDFLFSATVWWRPVPDRTDRSDSAFSSLARSSIVSRAREIVRHEEPGRASFAQYLLDGELGVPLPDRSGRVKALADGVTLVLAPADRERLRKLNDLRKDEELWEYERQHERNKRRYLGEDVLKSAGSAVVWWLARHEDEIDKAVRMIGPLAQISAAANDEEVPELFRHLLVPPVGGRGEMSDREQEVGIAVRLHLLLAEAGLKPDMDGYAVLAHRVVRSLREQGLDEAAEEIERTFFSAPDEEPSDGENAGGPWPPPFSGPEDSLFTDTAAAPDADATERDRGPWETGEDSMAPPPFWDPSYSSHRPSTPRVREDDGSRT
ncbi:hypothetical protein [Streptomyces bikiniensis]|uniref:hypothetical protein n=1 Tax=Streptomyces bikiniensis TaxID=1896 RepID=UPI0004C23C7F|nr:hypothetical protein [Streptomyces bikiniensis]